MVQVPSEKNHTVKPPIVVTSTFKSMCNVAFGLSTGTILTNQISKTKTALVIYRLKQDYSGGSSLKHDGKLITNTISKAEELNTQLQSVFTHTSTGSSKKFSTLGFHWVLQEIRN